MVATASSSDRAPSCTCITSSRSVQRTGRPRRVLGRSPMRPPRGTRDEDLRRFRHRESGREGPSGVIEIRATDPMS